MNPGWFTPNNAQLKNILTGVPANVAAYGAVGDGVIDDTAAIQAAINSWGTYGGPVYVPPGIYKTTATITVPSRTHIMGSGARDKGTSSNATRILNTTANSPALFAIANQAFDVSFSGMYLELSTTGTVGQVIQGAVGNYYLDFSRLTIVGGVYGIGLTAGTANVRMTDLEVLSQTNNCIDLNNVSAVSMTDVILHNAYGRAESTGNLKIYGNSQDVTIQGMYIDEAWQNMACILVGSADRVQIKNLRIYHAGGGYGIRLGLAAIGNPTNVTIDNVKIQPHSAITTAPINTIYITAGVTGTVLRDVTTALNANGGGDISDNATDTVFRNVNGQTKLVLPTSNPGAGLLWNDGGTVKVGT